MKYLLLTIIFVFSFNAFAETKYYFKTSHIDGLKITAKSTHTEYYVTSKDGRWQTLTSNNKCHSPGYAYFSSKDQGASDFLALSMAARISNVPVTIVAVCGHHENYIRVKEIFIGQNME